jgi:general secretion pathway protein D
MRSDRGLTGIDISSAGDGGESGIGAGGGAGEGGAGGGVQAGQAMQFPWQQARPDEDIVPESALIGRVRVVPVKRQNAVMVLAAPEYRDAVRGMILALDKPGRQVMIAAIIAEIELGDDLSLGVRVSNSGAILGEGSPDFRLGGNVEATGSSTDLFDIFDTSTLDVGVNLNIVLQALAQKSKVRVLQEPRVFTADNQEAAFFQGQDVPILTTTQTTDTGTVNESVDYEAVGVGLNVRPRITSTGDIDMEVNLVISNINRAAGIALNSPTFDRRETTTKIIVRNGQTIAISGILRDEESRIQRKVPLLGDIPVLGWAFKSEDNTMTRTELIAFITPVVVDNPSDNDNNFQEGARERLENLSKPLDEQERTDLDPNKVRQRLLHHQFGHGEPLVDQ